MTQRDPATGYALPGVDLPEWLRPVADAVAGVKGSDLTRFLPPPSGGRASAVLMLLGEGDRGPDLLLIERARAMRSHAGQPAFPGGALDPGDAGPIAAALREAQEETALDPSGVEPFALLPDLWVPVSDFIVTPVLAWWREPSPVRVADPSEVASVHRVPIEELADPARRMRVRHPSGYVGSGFDVAGLLVWGFTAGLISGLLDLADWSRPWDPERIVDLDPGEELA
jgi:8-oxo-dGTP pyrophosphatase MutT (NUDIX family)